MTKAEIIEVLAKLGYKTIQHKKFGDLIEMDAEDAFVFSSIIGSSYLIYPYGITMKGRYEVFIHRALFSDGYYIYSPGLFGRNIEGKLIEENSADMLLKKYPAVFKNKKYIYIEDIKTKKLSNVENNIFNLIKSEKEDPSNYLVYKNFESGASAESLFEYLASMEFIKSGYITENQVPWFQQNLKHNGKTLQGGIPDFSAFHCRVSSYLKSLGIITENRGVSITLLPVIKNFRVIKNDDSIKTKTQYELIIGEVKSSKSSLAAATVQIKKYGEVQLANKLFTIIPNVADNQIDFVGEMFVENNTFKVKGSNVDITIDKDRQSHDDEWISNYIKILLLGNLPFKKIVDFIEIYRKNTNQTLLENYEAVHLLDAVIMTQDKYFFEYFIKN